MIPYFVLILIPAVLSYLSVSRDENGRRVIRIGASERVRRSNAAITGFFVCLLLLLMLRGETVGRDLSNYHYIFLSRKQWPLRAVLSSGDVLYVLLNWLIGQFTDNFQWVLAVSALLCILPIVGVYQEERRYSYLKVVLFVNMSTYTMFFSGIRQAIAISLGMAAYRFVRKRKPLLFVLAVLVAFGFHHSAFILLCMYPLYYASFKRKHLLIIVPSILVVFAFNQQIFGLLTRLMSMFSDKYDSDIIQTGALGSLILFALFAVFSFWITDETAIDRETMGLRNFLLASVVLQCFAPIHMLAMRMNYYYIIFIPMLLPRIILSSKSRYQQIARLANAVMCGFFTLDFLSGIYKSYVTGISALDTVPYVPFWRG